eukprot:TRINITY_DN4855_c0_g1_i6.p1 TRINITY_DN4855_c0_g1~~TRINITY_DN4855_c0_g1_i6.p1  ORF type:complete len:275 (-),score=35.86 TRINITY_DN4855_c0_g1_i6:25-849(-)
MTGLTLTDLPLELIALISGLVDNFDDLARMSLVCHRVRNGVLLSRQWIVVEEIVAATGPDGLKEQRFFLHDRRECSIYACENGLLRCLRALNLSRREVLASSRNSGNLLYYCASAPGPLALDVCRYLHKTYALTVEELVTPWVHYSWQFSPMSAALDHHLYDMFKYLHAEVGMDVPREVLYLTCQRGRLETLKYLHRVVGFTAEDVRHLSMRPMWWAGDNGHRDILIYLRDGYGIGREDCIVTLNRIDGNQRYRSKMMACVLIREVFVPEMLQE